MENNVKWVNFRAGRLMTKEDRRTEEINARLRRAIMSTIVDMSQKPMSPQSITSRDELIIKATNGLVTLGIYEETGVDISSLSEQETEMMRTNIDSLLGIMTGPEISIARYRADNLLGME